jgi:hypothetical protein
MLDLCDWLPSECGSELRWDLNEDLADAGTVLQPMPADVLSQPVEASGTLMLKIEIPNLTLQLGAFEGDLVERRRTVDLVGMSLDPVADGGEVDAAVAESVAPSTFREAELLHAAAETAGCSGETVRPVIARRGWIFCFRTVAHKRRI